MADTPLLHPRVASLAKARTPVVGKRRAQRQDKENALLSNLRQLPVTITKEKQEERELRFPSNVKPKMPSRIRPMADPHSSACGRFAISHRGIKRKMRRIPAASQTAVTIASIEHAIVDWLESAQDEDGEHTERVIDETQVEISENGPQKTSIVEIQRSFACIQWSVAKSSTRFLIHLVARLWDVVSFSRDDETCKSRITYLLRPNAVLPDPYAMRHGPEGMATPPTTDHDLSSSGILTDLSTSDAESYALISDSESDSWSGYSSDASSASRRRRSLTARALPLHNVGSQLSRTLSLDDDAAADVSDLDSTDGSDALADSIEQLQVNTTPTRWERIQ